MLFVGRKLSMRELNVDVNMDVRELGWFSWAGLEKTWWLADWTKRRRLGRTERNWAATTTREWGGGRFHYIKCSVHGFLYIKWYRSRKTESESRTMEQRKWWAIKGNNTTLRLVREWLTTCACFPCSATKGTLQSKAFSVFKFLVTSMDGIVSR